MKKFISLICTMAFWGTVNASVISLSLLNNGNEIDLMVTIDDMMIQDDSYLAITTEVSSGYYGDISAIYIDMVQGAEQFLLSDFDLLVQKYDNNSGEEIFDTKPIVSEISEKNMNKTDNIKNYNWANMKGNNGFYDAGVLISDQGIGTNSLDISPASVLIRNDNYQFNVDDIEKIGVRLQSIGIEADVRELSAKLVYVQPEDPVTSVPEPSVLVFVGSGLICLLIAGKRKN